MSSSLLTLRCLISLRAFSESTVIIVQLCVCPHRIERLAHYIKDDFGDNNITVLCVLKGGYKFCADLVEFIKVLGQNSNKYLETRVEFIRLKSYLVGGQDIDRGTSFPIDSLTKTKHSQINTLENSLSAGLDLMDKTDERLFRSVGNHWSQLRFKR